MSEEVKNQPLNGGNKEIGIPEALKTPEVKKPSLDAILIFGQGPVLNTETRMKVDKDNTRITDVTDINMWAKTLATAAYELYKRGQTREFIVLGGRTGEEAYLSEADKIAEEMTKCGVPKEVVRREQGSSNTLENITNALNDYVDATDQYQKIGVLGSNFHIPRIKLLMRMFNIPYEEAFSAEEVMRYVAREGKEWEYWDQEKLLEVERRLDMTEAAKTPLSLKDKVNLYYQKKQGEEKKNIARRGQEEDVYSRALLDVPENWLIYLARLNNTERMLKILLEQDEKMLEEKFGIDLSSDTSDVIKQKLSSINRIKLDPDEYAGKEWPGEIVEKLEDLVGKRQK